MNTWKSNTAGILCVNSSGKCVISKASYSHHKAYVELSARFTITMAGHNYVLHNYVFRFLCYISISIKQSKKTVKKHSETFYRSPAFISFISAVKSSRLFPSHPQNRTELTALKTKGCVFSGVRSSVRKLTPSCPSIWDANVVEPRMMVVLSCWGRICNHSIRNRIQAEGAIAEEWELATLSAFWNCLVFFFLLFFWDRASLFNSFILF